MSGVMKLSLQRHDSISSLHDTSCLPHAAAAAVDRRQTGCYTVVAAVAGGLLLAAVTGMTWPFVGRTAVRLRRPVTAAGDDTTAG